jgi:hypothetical protein
MKKQKLLISFFLFISLAASACRFTVREIGFSTLSQDIYTLAVIDENANPNDSFWKDFHRQNKDCNIRLDILNPAVDKEHPIIIAAKEKGISFPATVLVSPDRRIFLFGETDFLKIYKKVKDSFLREKMRLNYPEVFAVVFWVNGKDADKNKLIKTKIRQECDAIENIMPSMPKIVKRGPIWMEISGKDFQKESLLLWSLKLESVPEEPEAFVLYGRGRIMGEKLNFKQIMDGGLYKYMSMIGADCECALDRAWMLGHQIPLFWPAETRQHLVKLVGFDVDNPMILAEMSRILTMVKISDASGSVAFAPESIDLDEVFGSLAPKVKVEEQVSGESKTGKMLIYTLLSFVVIVVAGGAIIIFKKR